VTPNTDTGALIDAAFRYLPPRRRNHYGNEPWWEWLAIEYHLSQPCAMENHDLCRNVFVLRMPRMPTGYCECICHSRVSPNDGSGAGES
jgi:hypothetical protein